MSAFSIKRFIKTKTFQEWQSLTGNLIAHNHTHTYKIKTIIKIIININTNMHVCLYVNKND